MTYNIVTGEKIQTLCDIYLGDFSELMYNPFIAVDTSKHVILEDINSDFNNPFRIFCYTHNINLLSSKLHFFKNKFILVTHNSDGEIKTNNEVLNILNCKNVLIWYSQNICITHPKLYFLPIGIANSQWEHGNLSLFNNTEFMKTIINKTNKVYFNFNINTNKEKRQTCYDSLIDKLEWLNNTNPIDNLKRLSTYKFCICPEGNGVDTHRLWECLYLNVVPIVIQSDFTEILLKNKIPVCVINNWSDLNIDDLDYNSYVFNTKELLTILNFSINYI